MFIPNVFDLCFLLSVQTISGCKLLAKFEVRNILKEGDIMIGGIFPVYSRQENILFSFDNKPPMAECKG